MIDCKFPSGSITNLRHLTTVAIVVKDGQVLLTKRGTYKGKPIHEYGKWTLPGGYLDTNENSIQGIEREVLEETGSKISNIKLLSIFDNPVRRNCEKQNITFVFVADFVSCVEIKTEEVLEQKWFDLNNLPPAEEIAFNHADDLQLYKDLIASGKSTISRWPTEIF